MTPDALYTAVLAAAGSLAPEVPPSSYAARIQLRRVACHPWGAVHRTNAALRLAPLLRRPAPEIARLLAARLSGIPGVAAAEAAPDGFVAVHTAPLEPAAVLAAVAHRADGRVGDAAADVRGRIVIVAADGTGAAAPSWRWARQAVTADALARVLRAEGAEVVVAVPSDAVTAAWCERLGVVGEAADGDASARTPGAGCPIPADVHAARSGGGESVDDALYRVGVDAVRWGMLAVAPRTEAVLDLDALGRRTDGNPVFTVQFAHAHAEMLVRHAAALGVDTHDLAAAGPSGGAADGPPGSSDAVLLAELAEYPAAVARAARRREVTPVPRQLLRLAGAYHALVRDCPVLPLGDRPFTGTHRFRLRMVVATRDVLASGLGVLGLLAPERV